ncbi:MAG: hypothetical protein GY799_31945 [Desulfobulbaceae bacterium]|jgi:hypothetical protein|nr:hypothetical protein [Desulfobulbaceae bacterium]
MNKVTAHLVIAVLDLAALLACYFVVSEWQSIEKQLALGAEGITFQSYFGVYGLLLIVPLTHIVVLFKWQGAVRKWVNRFLVTVFLVMGGTVFILNSYLENKIITAGYLYCQQQSEMMTFSNFKTYLREDIPCSK